MQQTPASTFATAEGPNALSYLFPYLLLLLLYRNFNQKFTMFAIDELREDCLAVGHAFFSSFVLNATMKQKTCPVWNYFVENFVFILLRPFRLKFTSRSGSVSVMMLLLHH